MPWEAHLAPRYHAKIGPKNSLEVITMRTIYFGPKSRTKRAPARRRACSSGDKDKPPSVVQGQRFERLFGSRVAEGNRVELDDALSQSSEVALHVAREGSVREQINDIRPQI